MRSVEKLNKIADKFERKIVKFASDSENVEISNSEVVTTSARKVINEVLETVGKKTINELATKLLKRNLDGQLVLGEDFYLTAKKSSPSDPWKVTLLDFTQQEATGDFADEKYKPEIDAAFAKIKSVMISLIEKDMNRQSSNFIPQNANIIDTVKYGKNFCSTIVAPE